MTVEETAPAGVAEAGELDTYDLNNASCRLLKRALKRAGEIVAEEIGEAGLRPRPFMTLIAIYQNPGITQNDLVKLTGSDRSTVGELIGRFEARGDIARKRDRKDQRVNLLYVTAAGTRALRHSLRGTVRAEERIRALIAPAMRGQFFDLLERLGGDDDPAPRRPADAPDRASTASIA